ARDWSTSGVERQVIARSLVEPAWRHDPGVFVLEISLLRPGSRGLVPGVPLVHRVAQRVLLYERLAPLPVVVVGAAQQDANVQIDVHQIRGNKFAVDDDTGG